MTAICVFFSIVVIYRTPCVLGNQYKRYFSRMRLLRSSDEEEKFRLKALRKLYRVVYTNIRGLHKNLSDLSFIARCGDAGFVLGLFSLPGVIFPSSRFQVLVD